MGIAPLGVPCIPGPRAGLSCRGGWGDRPPTFHPNCRRAAAETTDALYESASAIGLSSTAIGGDLSTALGGWPTAVRIYRTREVLGQPNSGIPLPAVGGCPVAASLPHRP